ncbi:uncharacterized protein LOC9636093 [Selaginella moellendorffii]|uniref:uncharacterized protein LOC9636093 n=1 Tax=Selaginella moellendorffii TaxID=88036 RepID=UPI000D1CFC4F|nr:uncharacterized protein LOC9636093 [Selaginella moellendorffii]|eukprot:XP_024527781.1 uncharacterized protein LOC9636093 [Selaginella moellendorffii]
MPRLLGARPAVAFFSSSSSLTSSSVSLWISPGIGGNVGLFPRQHALWLFRRGMSSKISMSLRSGIVGLPNVGKSTLFNALVENAKAQAANFPFCTIEPNVGIVAVPDTRLSVLTDISSSKQTVPASMEFVDIAGLVKGASKGEGLGNKFLQHIREVDSIVQVVRCFDDSDILHVNGKVDPEADIDIINLELAFSDIAQIEKRLEKLKKGRAKDPQTKAKEDMEAAALERINEALLAGKAARTVDLSNDERKQVQQLCLLTMKPVIYAANVAETDLGDPSKNEYVQRVVKTAADLGSEAVVVSAQVESELAELDAKERKEFLESLGAAEGGLGSLVKATYSLLGLRTYFTTGEKETKAWTIKSGMTAPQAAGVIHSDFERGFIRAETVAYKDFVSVGSLQAAREKGLLRSEGKDYVVQEGDVMLFRFNV